MHICNRNAGRKIKVVAVSPSHEWISILLKNLGELLGLLRPPADDSGYRMLILRDAFLDPLLKAAQETSAKAVVISGGVAANRKLRSLLKQKADDRGIASFIPSMKFCTDNAAMIAYVGEKRLELGQESDFTLNAVGNQEIGV